MNLQNPTIYIRATEQTLELHEAKENRKINAICKKQMHSMKEEIINPIVYIIYTKKGYEVQRRGYKIIK